MTINQQSNSSQPMKTLSDRSIKRYSLKRLALAILLPSALPAIAFAAAPEIGNLSDIQVTQGDHMVVSAQLTNGQSARDINWTKDYGPDAVKVNPVTGAISWQLPISMAGESFHVGIRASNKDGFDTENFIIHVGSKRIVYVGPNETVKDFEDAFADWRPSGRELAIPGTTFVVRNGTYSGQRWTIGLTQQGGIQMPPAGTPNQYTTVMAEDPGQVIFENGKIVGEGKFAQVAYWAIKGFHFEGGNLGVNGVGCSPDSCQPHHVKFIRNGVNMGPAESSLGAGHAHHILFENNYAYGGNRVKFLAYKTAKSVFRRNVARFDHDQYNNGPKNTFSFYTSMDIIAQNNIVIDADATEFMAHGEMAGEFGCPTTAGDSRIRYDRSIQLNSEMLLSNIDLQNGKCEAVIEDMVAWDNRAPGALVMSRSPSWFNHATFGDINPDEDPLVFFNAWPGMQARGITNSVLHDFGRGKMFEGMSAGSARGIDSTFERFGIDTNNFSKITSGVAGSSSTIKFDTLTYHDPIWTPEHQEGGLRYLVRIEPNSNLSGKAQDGGDLGATVMTFKGQSGTLWGEDDFEVETNVKSWPFPFQGEIATKMRSMRHTGPAWRGTWNNRSPDGTKTLSGDRGFAKADTDLTDYIWGYLGSTVPPMNVTGTGANKAAIIRWDLPASKTNAQIDHYVVYDYNPADQSLSNPRKAGNNTSFTVKGLTNGEDRYFAVTAVSEATGESSYSYPVKAVASERPRPMAPKLWRQGTE